MKKIIYIILLLISVPTFSKTFFDYFYRIDGFYNNAKFIDKNKLVLVGSAGRVVFSLNNGESWYSNYTNTSETLFDCDIEPNTNTLFCAGANGTVIKTSDLGKTWESVKIDNNLSFYSISFSKKMGLIATSNGKIYKSTDLGNNWAKLDLTSPNLFRIVKILTNSSIIAIDMNCRIFISKDDGENWIAINNKNELVDGLCGGLSIKDEMMVVYTSNGLLISYDNGLTWTFKEIIDKDIFGLSILSKYQVRILCRIPNDGSIYRYFDMYDVDFEKDLKVTKIENTLDKYYLFYQSYPMGFITNELSEQKESIVYGTLNSIMISYDKLQTWQAKSYYRSGSYPNLFVINSDTIYAGTDRNNIFHTYNGGATWLPQKDSSGLITPYSINSLYFTDGMNGIAFQFNGINKMYTNNSGITFDAVEISKGKTEGNSIKDSLIYCHVSNIISINSKYTKINVTIDGGKNYNQTIWEYEKYSISIAPFNFLENGQMITIASKVDSVKYDTVDISKAKFYKSFYYLSTNDYGKTWNWDLITDLDDPTGLKILSDSLAFIYTSDTQDSLNPKYYLYKSIDNLKTWKIVLETPNRTLEISPSNLEQIKNGKMIINGLYGELYVTKDYGDTWELLMDTLVINLNTGLLHHANSSYYMTTMRAGLYKSIPGVFDYLTDVEDEIETIESGPEHIWLYEPYPNPVSNNLSFEMIWIKNIKGENIKIQISDYMGNIIKDVSNEPRSYLLDNKAKVTINVGNMNSGVYYISASTKNYKRTIPFVVVK
jgi:photosystem II stability/assembly factor-like uncharacterized protein